MYMIGNLKKKLNGKKKKKKKEESGMNRAMIANLRLEFVCSRQNEHFVVKSFKYAQKAK